MMSPTTKDQAAVLDQLNDLTPECGYSLHRTTSTQPAVWLVRFTCPMPCGCPGQEFVLFCDWCWAIRNSQGWVLCPSHEHNFPCMASVLSVERV